MEKEKLIGIILAAGEGNRMYPFSQNLPKPLLPVCGEPLIYYQLKIMQKLNLKKVIIVIGKSGLEIVKKLSKVSFYNLDIIYVEQKERLGIAHALGQLETKVKFPFLLFLGDIFFISEKINKMVSEFKKNKASAILAAKYEKDKEAIKRNFAIILAKNKKTVKRVIEKPRYIQNNLKGCGIYLFDLHIFDAIRRTPRTALRDEYEITEAIQILIEDGMRVEVLPIIEEDLNLTYPHDLLSINLLELKRRNLKIYLGENCKIKNKNKIINSVIGDNVKIEKDIQIKNSLIFSEVKISLNDFVNIKKLENIILTPEELITVPT